MLDFEGFDSAIVEGSVWLGVLVEPAEVKRALSDVCTTKPRPLHPCKLSCTLVVT